ncbi:MAG: hypothetical protein KBC41_01910 [Candidatus Pacebacteria bacterium]|nr:hypothetical protein [Candidatus Paceibacterota bacterium]MBP9866813.1 hypothetical protein [Candidatus Paceibacterota bacterium]
MADKVKNHCERLVPGGEDCINQIKKGYCSFSDSKNTCLGRTGAIGSNIEKGKSKAEEYRLKNKK